MHAPTQTPWENSWGKQSYSAVINMSTYSKLLMHYTMTVHGEGRGGGGEPHMPVAHDVIAVSMG